MPDTIPGAHGYTLLVFRDTGEDAILTRIRISPATRHLRVLMSVRFPPVPKTDGTDAAERAASLSIPFRVVSISSPRTLSHNAGYALKFGSVLTTNSRTRCHPRNSILGANFRKKRANEWKQVKRN